MLSRINDRVALLATVVFLALTVLTCLCCLTIFINPYMPLNPFPPPRGVGVASPTPTRTPEAGATFPPTWTPTHTATPTDTPLPTDTPTITPTATNTPTPTFTPTATRTPAPPPTATRTHTPIPSPTPWPYVLDSMTAKLNDLNGAGCSWLGAAGRINGAGTAEIVAGIGVRVSSNGWSQTCGYGDTSAYGSAGWEVYLDDHPKAGTWYAQVVDASGAPLSEKVTFQTIDNCYTNLILIDFRKSGD